MEYGITSTGFIIKRIDIIKLELEASYREKFGESIDLDPESFFGQLIGIHAEREALIWEGMQAMYFSQYRATAEGTSLDDVNALVLVPRLEALASTATIRARGDVNTLIPTGSVVSLLNNTDVRFTTQTDYIIASPTNNIQKLIFSEVPTSGTYTISFAGQTTTSLAYNASAANIVSALEALNNIEDVEVTGDYSTGFTIEFQGVDGEIQQKTFTTTSSLFKSAVAIIIDVIIVDEGGSYIDMRTICTVTGPIIAAANTLVTIETSISGWDSAYNIESATPGRDIETDEDYRLRAEQSTQQSKSGTTEAIRNTILEVDNVLNASVLENTTLVVDTDGIPGKAFEAIVSGGLDQDIFDTIWATKPAGIQSFGNTSGTALDSQGVAHDISFSRPENVLIYIDITVTVKTGYTTTEEQVSGALLSYGLTLGVAQDVIVFPDLVAALANLHLIDIAIAIGTSPNPTLDDNINISARQQALFSTARINVTIS